MVWTALLAVGLALSPPAAAEDFRVATQAEYRAVAKRVRPGDRIILANGVWRDFQIVLNARGTREQPIELTAETKGGVILSGASNLRMGGSYLVVSGLVFRDGASPTDEVIAFRRDSKTPAVHSRLTEVVIDHYNKPDRRAEDIWVALYGHDNRVDHGWFAGKGNAGVTLAVIRPKGQPQPNRHRIDSNYFGPRPPLGSNGGETIRIGTSEESLSRSDTVVEGNYFDRTSGEVEIISIKSGGNVIRGNTIRASQGSIVLRHGNGNLVERNVILADGEPNSGGIRVINRDQIVRDNYIEGSRGTGFTSALAVMNGVPNSAINRYHQVSGAIIERNSFISVARLTFGAGADAERTAPPVGSRFSANLITAAAPGDVIRFEGDTSGITFSGNVVGAGVSKRLPAGFQQREVRLARAANGLLYPVEAALASAGAPRDLRPVGKADVGPRWYTPPKPVAGFGSGRTIGVKGGAGSLASAAAGARPGDVLRLAPGSYRIAAPVEIGEPLTIDGAGLAELSFTSPTLFQLRNGGSLRLEGLRISGAAAPHVAGNAVIRAPLRSAIANYTIEMEGVEMRDMAGVPGFDVIATTPGTKAARIAIARSRFSDVSGAVVAAAAETGREGLYPAEEIAMSRSRFERVGQVADVARLGTDESTFGPVFTLVDSEVRGGGSPAIRLSGVQRAIIERNLFHDAGRIEVAHSVGFPVTVIRCNRLVNTPPPRLSRLYSQGSPSVTVADNGPGKDRSCRVSR